MATNPAPTATTSAAAYRTEIDSACSAALEFWDTEAILGLAGAQFVKSHAIATSSHEFVVATTLLLNQAPLANGAVVNLFSDNDTPLNCAGTLIGYPQTRKSQMTKMSKEIQGELDAFVQEEIRRRVDEAGEDASLLRCASLSLSSFTPTLFFERCSGDFQVVLNPEEFKTDEVRKPVHFGRSANADELYQVFNDLGMTQGDKKKPQQASNVVNEYAGMFNRFLQFGESSRATKTGGSYGEGRVPPVSFALLGNMHPEMGVPMERGEIGSHIGATKERLLLYGAPRVQPHDALPDGYTLPDGVTPWSWVPLDEELAKLAGLESVFRDPDAAAASDLQRADAAPSMQVDYAPDEEGYLITLPDGVASRLRYKVSGGVPVPEIRIANRDFELPDEHSLRSAARRVLKRFAKANRKMQRSEGTKKALLGLQTMYNVKAAMAADAGDDMEAALWGISPWKLGVIVGLLVPLDVFVGNPSLGSDDEASALTIPPEYVLRARKWLDALNAYRRALRKPASQTEAPPHGQGVVLPPAMQAVLAPGYVAPSGFGDFAPPPAFLPDRRRRRGGGEFGRLVRARVESNQNADSVVSAAAPGDHAADSVDGRAPAGASTSGPLPPTSPAGAGASSAAAAPDAVSFSQPLPEFQQMADAAAQSGEEIVPKDASQGVPLTVGYAEDGSSVQGANPFWPDRKIMLKVVTRGEPVVKTSTMMGNIRKHFPARPGVPATRPGIPAKKFEAVMRAAFAKYPIATLLDEGTSRSRVVFARPPEGNREQMTLYHNMLVDLCQVSLRTFTDDIRSKDAERR